MSEEGNRFERQFVCAKTISATLSALAPSLWHSHDFAEIACFGLPNLSFSVTFPRFCWDVCVSILPNYRNESAWCLSTGAALGYRRCESTTAFEQMMWSLEVKEYANKVDGMGGIFEVDSEEPPRESTTIFFALKYKAMRRLQIDVSEREMDNEG